LAGSSTALVAVLDYVPAGERPTAKGVNGKSTTKGVNDKRTDATDTDAPLTPVLKIAHLGDCMGMLVRGGEVAWRSEEMWWRWNTPVQLTSGTPKAHAEVTPASAAHLFTLPVRAGDILILASDGLGDNLWDEDVLEEVGRVVAAFGGVPGSASVNPNMAPASNSSRTRTPSEGETTASTTTTNGNEEEEVKAGEGEAEAEYDEDETPFARRARETGRVFRGGKNDDISVIVAVISPAEGYDRRRHGGRVEAARAAGS
ncbi:hypothetical protein C8R43DRAFT_1195321, partial [Mycena crocata]